MPNHVINVLNPTYYYYEFHFNLIETKHLGGRSEPSGNTLSSPCLLYELFNSENITFIITQ